MKLCEEFYSLQGEGRYIGVPSYFIRTIGCNLRCSWRNPNNTITICDTPYSSFNAEKGYDLDIVRLYETISQLKCKHIVITGGEPTLQKDLFEVVDFFSYKGYHITIETNGTKFIDFGHYSVLLSISPKLKSSYNQTDEFNKILHEDNNVFIENIIKYRRSNSNIQLKFVYNTSDDIIEIRDILYRTNIDSDNVYLMPQGITVEQFKEKSRECFEYCKLYGWNYSPRLHIDVYGNKRGV